MAHCQVTKCAFASSELAQDLEEVLTLHVPITATMKSKQFMQNFIAAAEGKGRHIRTVEVDEWSDLLQSMPKENAFSAFNDGRFDDGVEGIEAHPCEKTKAWISKQGVHIVPKSEDCYTKFQIQSLVSYLLRREPLLKRRLLLRTLSSS